MIRYAQLFQNYIPLKLILNFITEGLETCRPLDFWLTQKPHSLLRIEPPYDHSKNDNYIMPSMYFNIGNMRGVTSGAGNTYSSISPEIFL